MSGVRAGKVVIFNKSLAGGKRSILPNELSLGAPSYMPSPCAHRCRSGNETTTCKTKEDKEVHQTCDFGSYNCSLIFLASFES
jgi:hypothetical protein